VPVIWVPAFKPFFYHALKLYVLRQRIEAIGWQEYKLFDKWRGWPVKGRQSGMPAEDYWNSFFDAGCLLSKLHCDEHSGDVIEFGCGYGLFTETAATRTRGTVYALDIDPEMIEATRLRVTRAGLSNVCTEQRDFLADGCGRPDRSVGYVMLFNILHIEESSELLREAYRVLKRGGKLGIIHWNYDPTTPRGPSMDIRPRPEQCRTWAEATGFHFLRFEPLQCCAHHYGLVLQRPVHDKSSG
jgi:SAM-dependent methyltransferase